MVDMAAMVATDMARGLPMLMPTTAMEAMAVMGAMVATDMARGRLTLMPTTAMEVMAAMVATGMARDLLMPTMVDTDMAVDTAAMVVMAMASKCNKSLKYS